MSYLLWIRLSGDSLPASSLQQMVSDCACEVVMLAASGAHRTVFVLLFLPVNTGVFNKLQSHFSFVTAHAPNFIWLGLKWKS